MASRSGGSAARRRPRRWPRPLSARAGWAAVAPYGNDQQREEAVVSEEPEGRRAGDAELVVQHVVDQAVVVLEHERPGDDRGVRGKRVRREEDRAQGAAAAERVLR